MTTATQAPANVASALIDRLIASNRGDRNAFTFGDKRYSYQDVAALMNRAGNMMKARGIPHGAAVLVMLPGSPAFVATVLGGMKAGAMPVIGPTGEQTAQIAACLAACRPALVVVHQKDFGAAREPLASAGCAVSVVGGDGREHPSFVDEIRTQSSWLVAEPVSGDAPALGAWNGASVTSWKHGELAKRIEASDAASVRAGLPPRVADIVEMLRGFASGEPVRLP